jgi:hypothetical protein
MGLRNPAPNDQLEDRVIDTDSGLLQVRVGSSSLPGSHARSDHQ